MWTRRRTRERELSAELQSHLDMHIADNIRAGMMPDEARRQALIALGGMEQTRERYRDAITFRWIDALLKDIQFGFRTMRRSAGFTMLAIVTLAVGIAATNTGFTIMNTVLIRDLPFEEPDRVVESASTNSGGDLSGLSYADFKDWERSTRSFAGIAAIRTRTMNVSDDDRRARTPPRRLCERVRPFSCFAYDQPWAGISPRTKIARRAAGCDSVSPGLERSLREQFCDSRP